MSGYLGRPHVQATRQGKHLHDTLLLKERHDPNMKRAMLLSISLALPWYALSSPAEDLRIYDRDWNLGGM
ncbi:MAG: hypothetical protein QHH30_09525 [candidate division NC10 bacterium]|nr:hypothetical protein [candidate division NC10 bacterium]